MIIVRQSPLTGKINSMDLDITPRQLFAWQTGTLAQDAFPHLSPDEREFVISGLTPDDWQTMYGNVSDEPQDREGLVDLTGKE